MKLKQIFAAALLFCTAGAWAQTDVTSTYITNADFSQGTPITVGTCTYEKDKAGNSTNYAQLVPVDGWDIPANGDARAGGLIAFGSGVWIGGPGYIAPATNSDGDADGNILGLVGVWTGTAQYTQDVTLPAGTYTLVLGVYNSVGGTSAFTKNLIGFIENGGAEHLASTKNYAVNTWKYEFITFTLAAETAGKISLGYQGSNVGSAAAQHLFLSGIQLFDGEVDAEAYEAAKTEAREAKEAKVLWDNAVTAANQALASTDYVNVTGSEKATLQAELAKAEPTDKDGYNAATSALNEATAAFTTAKRAYDLVANAPTLEYAKADKKPAITSESTAATLTTALRAYYESHAMAEKVADAVNMTDRIANANNPTNNNGWTWTGSKNNPASNEPWTDADGTNTHSYFDGGNWNGSNWTTTMEQTISLPAGKFLLTAKGRAATNTTLTMAVGEKSVELPNVGSVGNVFDRGWGDASVEFVTDGSDVTITVTATAAPTHEWFSISDFRLVRLELYTEMAKAEDYENLEAAIATAKTKTLGFADGEFAPYNNVEAIKAITAAEAIDKNVENAKADVTDLITALGNWTANDGDVDAIYDGQFETTAANATSGDINLPGWTKVDGIRLLVKDEAIDPGLAYTDGKAAVFSWGGTTLTYGNQVGYTLPLNKYELYELTLKVTGWRDGDFANVFTVALDGDSKTVNPNVPGKINDAEGDPFASLKFYLTPTEDNSTLTIYANRHFAIADLSLKPAVAEEITINEGANYTPAETYANVTLTRTIKAGTWNTFVVPFDITNDELEAAFGDDVAVAEFSENSDDANAVTINFDMMDTPAITANKPVLLKGNAGTSFTFNGKLIKVGDAKVAGKNVDFVGTYAASTTVKAGDYFISANKLYKSEGSTTLKGTRAYIDAKNAAEVKLFIDGIETGISEINGTAVESGAIYNLAGQRVSNAQKGIYIVNGKKVIIK